MNITMHFPSPFTLVNNFHSILLPGYVFWDTPYTGRKVTSPVSAMAKRSQIIVLTARLYRLVVITTYPKASHFEKIGTCDSSLMIDYDFRLLDPKGMDVRTSCSPNVTSRRATFRQDVINRDRRCVLTGTEGFEACHIIPQAKGDQVRSGPLYRSRRSFQTKYIKNLIAYREVVFDPPLESINDTRNGFLLYSMLHSTFGTSRVAFLQVSYSMQSSSM